MSATDIENTEQGADISQVEEQTTQQEKRQPSAFGDFLSHWRTVSYKSKQLARKRGRTHADVLDFMQHQKALLNHAIGFQKGHAALGYINVIPRKALTELRFRLNAMSVDDWVKTTLEELEDICNTVSRDFSDVEGETAYSIYDSSSNGEAKAEGETRAPKRTGNYNKNYNRQGNAGYGRGAGRPVHKYCDLHKTRSHSNEQCFHQKEGGAQGESNTTTTTTTRHANTHHAHKPTYRYCDFHKTRSHSNEQCFHQKEGGATTSNGTHTTNTTNYNNNYNKNNNRGQSQKYCDYHKAYSHSNDQCHHQKIPAKNTDTN